MQKILVVVDMQNDFIDGALGTKEAQGIVEGVKQKIKDFDGKVIFTRDTHPECYLDTQEGKKLPVKHCIKDTQGWQITNELLPYVGDNVIDKPTFGSTELMELLIEENESEEIESITFIGLCTDICVISNVMLAKANFLEAEIIVEAGLCAGVTPQSHENALEAMKMCQITIK
ncbi:MAG: cysteine hydrolase [Clostridia bacterium]|nr:cysteine hydrolase [Clostridia bacterium]